MVKVGIPFFVSLLCIAAAANVHAQKISGTILDKKAKEPLPGATVVIKGTTTGTSADFDGNFSIEIKSFPATLVISFIGYSTKELEMNSAADRLMIFLESSEVMLKDIEITERRLTEKQRESALTVEAMDLIAIKETPAANFYEGLGHLKGVDLTSASLGFKVINTRGFNSTSPVRSLQIIDGVDNQSPGLNFSLGNFLGCSELDVLKVDLIVGASSAYYGPNAFNGVISMTTRSPFVKPGVEIMFKAGERSLFEEAIRIAEVFKDKKGKDRFAYKLNLFHMSARDWQADNLSPTLQSLSDPSNPGRYDAVNIYGDEYNLANDYTAVPALRPGLDIFYRTGYREKDLVDYNTSNTKACGAFHYRITDSTELIAYSSYGGGTTIYQGENRYSLKNIRFYQHRIELKKENKYFLRGYMTHEDAGNSYDAFFTALLLQDAAKSDIDYALDYSSYWGSNFSNKIKNFPGFPKPADYPTYKDYLDAIQPFLLANYYDSLLLYHDIATAYSNGKGAPNKSNLPFFVPGTAQFDSAFRAITSSLSYSEGGSRFYDKSALYHVHGEYKFTPAFAQVTVGANARMYSPDSKGTIFRDTSEKISNSQFGVYAGIEKKFANEKLKASVTCRLDKNENFPHVFSPAASLIYDFSKNHLARISFSSAIRNPTLADQYLYYKVGRAILIGNIDGFDSLVTIPSLIAAYNTSQPDSLEYFSVPPVVPEKVKTLEVGYRGSLFKHLFVDAGGYYSIYRDFIGYKLGAEVTILSVTNQPNLLNVYRVSTNSVDEVHAYGASGGIQYFFKKYYSLGGNYSWNKLDRRGSTDRLIPAYNTPEHKFNISLAGREIKQTWGFNINYKWIEGFSFEGSPQFTGFIESYYMVDVQVNKRFPKLKSTVKLGANNILNDKHYEVYGGPLVGRLGYVSVLVELH